MMLRKPSTMDILRMSRLIHMNYLHKTIYRIESIIVMVYLIRGTTSFRFVDHGVVSYLVYYTVKDVRNLN